MYDAPATPDEVAVLAPRLEETLRRLSPESLAKFIGGTIDLPEACVRWLEYRGKPKHEWEFYCGLTDEGFRSNEAYAAAFLRHTEEKKLG